MKARCLIDHEGVKRSPTWNALKLRGYQETEDDDGNPARLELRDCTCGSTLALFQKLPLIVDTCSVCYLPAHASETNDRGNHPACEAPCPTCGGEGTVTEDRARGHEHYTVEVECEDCGGSGERDDYEGESPLAAPASTPIGDRLDRSDLL